MFMGINDRFKFFKTEIFKATDTKESKIDYEIWLTSLSVDNYYYFISLLTPSRDDDFFVWSRNTEAYKLILKLLTPYEESVLER